MLGGVGEGFAGAEGVVGDGGSEVVGLRGLLGVIEGKIGWGDCSGVWTGRRSINRHSCWVGWNSVHRALKWLQGERYLEVG